jgi:hypothetical protein
MGGVVYCPHCSRKLTTPELPAAQVVQCPACGEQFATGQTTIASSPRSLRPSESFSTQERSIPTYPNSPSDEARWAEDRARGYFRRARIIAILLGSLDLFLAMALLRFLSPEKRSPSMSLTDLGGIALIAASSLLVGIFTLRKRRSLLREKDFLRIDDETRSLLRFGRIAGYIAIVAGCLCLLLNGLRFLRENL